jgi:hypothetical protein
MKTFIKWLEQTAQEDAVKIAVKGALGDLALGKEDSDWLNLDTADLSSSIKDAIINLGELKRFTNPEKALEVKNAVKKGIKIKDLITLVSNPTGNQSISTTAPPVLGGEGFI